MNANKIKTAAQDVLKVGGECWVLVTTTMNGASMGSRRQVHTHTVAREYGNHGIMVGWRWSRGLPEFSQCALGTVDMQEEVGR